MDHPGPPGAGGRHDPPVTRRQLVAAVMTGLVATPLAGVAQPTASASARIGLLGDADPGIQSRSLDAFRAGLRDLGWIEGRNTLELVVNLRAAEALRLTIPSGCWRGPTR
jgi:hypothetical protein